MIIVFFERYKSSFELCHASFLEQSRLCVLLLIALIGCYYSKFIIYFCEAGTSSYRP